MEEKKTYEQGIEEGYNFAIQKVLEALDIHLTEQPPEEELKEEFLNKPRK